MAGTLTASLTAAIVGDVFVGDANIPPTEIALTNGFGGNPGIFTFTTTEADIDFGALTGKKYVVIRNIGAANKIYIGPKSGGVMIEDLDIAPGEFAVVPLRSGVTWRGRSDASTATGQISGYN